MRKIILLLAMVFSIAVAAQDFPGKSIELLNGKELRVKPLAENVQKYGYREFYTAPDLKKVYKKEGSSTAYNALVGKVFKVLSYEPYKDSRDILWYKLKLENSQTGILYFNYDTKFAHSFPFEVIGGLDLPAGFYCDKMVEKASGDKDVRRYEFPSADGIMLHKLSLSNVEMYLATINMPGADRPEKGVIQRGAVLTLENGQEIQIPDEEVKTSSSGSGYYNTTTITLSGEDINLLKKYMVAKVKLHKRQVDFTGGKLLQEYAKCIN